MSAKPIRNIAIILAAGEGARLGHQQPKQFLKVAGKMLIEHTIDIFHRHALIDDILIVCLSNYIARMEEMIALNEFNKVDKVIVGGKHRNESSFIAIQSCQDQHHDSNLIFHDAVRPLISDSTITDCLTALKKYNAVNVAVTATDTIIEVNNHIIQNIPNRNNLMQSQTPQCFKLSTIKTAYDRSHNDKNFIATDDCGIVKKYLPNEDIFVVAGDPSNIKLTYHEDILVIDQLLSEKRHQDP